MNKNVLIIIAVILLGLGVREGLHAQGKLNKRFLENKGQITDQHGQPRPDIDFSIASGGVTVYIGSGHLHYQWAVPMGSKAGGREQGMECSMDSIKIYRMDVNLIGANKNAQLIKESKQSYYERYFLPYSGTEGIKVAAYEKIIYKNIYPSIDWVLYIKGDKMEYDFVVHHGGKVADIQMQYNGAEDFKINENGSFTAFTPYGQVTEAAPYSFQESGETVHSQFLLEHNILQFATGNYKGRLTIDPAVVWASYYGGNSFVGESIYDIGISKNKEVYAVGVTMSASNIATTGAFQTTMNGISDGFLFKIDSMQNRLWSTYYGGPGSESIENVSLDSVGNIFVGGQTSQPGLSTPGSHQQNFGGGPRDLFVAKFNPGGARIFCTYYGGDKDEFNARLEVVGSSIYLAGFTGSSNGIATNGAHQQTLADTLNMDAFVAKFDLNGVREWATYYGGEGDDRTLSVTGDLNGNIYLFGYTESNAGIATAGSHRSVRLGEIDHFLVKLNSKGIRQWGTYLGGAGRESTAYSTRNLDCDQAGNIYVTSTTTSTSGIATAGSHQGTLAGEEDAYLVKFNSNGEQQWGTYFGGEKKEIFIGVVCQDSNNIYICGSTMSTSQIASADAIHPAFSGTGMLSYGDLLLARFNHQGKNTFGSYYGGKGDELGYSMAYDPSGYVYVGGFTNSDSAIATPGSFQETYPGSYIYNGFIARFCFAPTPDLLAIAGPDTLCANDKATYTVAAVTDADEYIWSLPANWTGASKTNRIDITNGSTGGILGVQVVRCEDTSEIQYMEVYVRSSDPAIITVDSFNLGTVDAYASYQWLLNGAIIPGATGRNYTVTENGDYAVVTVTAAGCIDTSDLYKVRNVSISDLSIRDRIRIFPNPGHDNVLHIAAPMPVSAALYGIDGRLLKYSEEGKRIDVEGVKPGIYLIRISDRNGRLLKTEKWTKW